MRVSYSVRSLLLSFLLLALASSEKDNPSAGLSSASEPVGAPPCGQNSNEKRLLTLAGGSDVRRNWQTQEPERRLHSGYTGKDTRNSFQVKTKELWSPTRSNISSVSK